MDRYDIHAARRGDVWCRDSIVHSSREPFACALNVEDVGKGRGPNGPYLEMGCCVLIGGWYDEPIRTEDHGRMTITRARGFCRWFYLVGYGYIHESNLFGFFRRIL
jgi:hypothetical protein